MLSCVIIGSRILMISDLRIAGRPVSCRPATLSHRPALFHRGLLYCSCMVCAYALVVPWRCTVPLRKSGQRSPMPQILLAKTLLYYNIIAHYYGTKLTHQIRVHQIRSIKGKNSKFSWGSMPPDPPRERASRTTLFILPLVVQRANPPS